MSGGRSGDLAAVGEREPEPVRRRLRRRRGYSAGGERVALPKLRDGRRAAERRRGVKDTDIFGIVDVLHSERAADTVA